MPIIFSTELSAMSDQASDKLTAELDRISSHLQLDKQVREAAAHLLSHLLDSQQSQVVAAHCSSQTTPG